MRIDKQRSRYTYRTDAGGLAVIIERDDGASAYLQGDDAAFFVRQMDTAPARMQQWFMSQYDDLMDLTAALPALNPTATAEQHASAAARIVADMEGGAV